MTTIEKIAMGCKPDPFDFKVVRVEIINNNTIIIANYGGKTFNGDKLMVLRGVFDVRGLKSLDPHFLDEDYAVVARFVPTEEGLELARLCAKKLGDASITEGPSIKKTSTSNSIVIPTKV